MNFIDVPKNYKFLLKSNCNYAINYFENRSFLKFYANNFIKMDLYITGAGVSSDSGIPTFRGSDGFWTIGSKNYTPQEMATRTMYKKSGQFLYGITNDLLNTEMLNQIKYRIFS